MIVFWGEDLSPNSAIESLTNAMKNVLPDSNDKSFPIVLSHIDSIVDSA